MFSRVGLKIKALIRDLPSCDMWFTINGVTGGSQGRDAWGHYACWTPSHLCSERNEPELTVQIQHSSQSWDLARKHEAQEEGRRYLGGASLPTLCHSVSSFLLIQEDDSPKVWKAARNSASLKPKHALPVPTCDERSYRIRKYQTVLALPNQRFQAPAEEHAEQPNKSLCFTASNLTFTFYCGVSALWRGLVPEESPKSKMTPLFISFCLIQRERKKEGEG